MEIAHGRGITGLCGRLSSCSWWLPAEVCHALGTSCVNTVRAGLMGLRRKAGSLQSLHLGVSGAEC